MRIDRADSEAELLGPPISNREIVKVVAGDFEVRLAQTCGRDRCRAGAALSHLLRGDGGASVARDGGAAARLRRVRRGLRSPAGARPPPRRGPGRHRRHLSPDPPRGGGEDGPLLFVGRIRHPDDDRLSRRGAGARPLVHRQGRAQHRDHADAVARHRALRLPLQHPGDVRLRQHARHRPARSMRRRCPISIIIISRRRRSACARCPSAT